jgi:hypothetical protein
MTTLRAACLALVLAASTACATEADGPPGGALTAESTTTSERTTQPTTSAPTTTEAPTTTAPPLPGFGAGTQLVGTDVQPGRYTSEGGTTCYWERLSGLSGTFEEIIVNATVEGQAIVEIVAGDAAFSSSGCGRWTVYQAPPSPVTEFGSGDWVVGEQIVPGRYQADGELCYWERAGGFTHDFGEILANGLPEGRAVVEIPAGDARFTSSGCGTWTPV